MSCLVAYADSSSENSDEDSDQDYNNLDQSVSDQKQNENDSPIRSRSITNKKRVLDLDLSSRCHSTGDQDEPTMKKKMREKTIEEDQIESRQMSQLPKSEKHHLSLPPAIQSMYDKKPTWADNPAQHEFKVRSFPHVEGNWATHVFIPVPEEEKFTSFTQRILNAFKPMKFHAMSEHHISLSRTVVIRHHWIDLLVDSVRSNLSLCKSCFADITSVKLFPNDEKTRTFVCLEVSADETCLPDYIQAVDKSFAEFKLPAYYEDPSFHISIGWSLGDVCDKISEDQLLAAKEMLASFCAANPDLSLVFVNQVCCQSGNKSFLIPLTDADV